MNSRWILFVSVIWLSSAAAQFGLINTIKKTVTKEVAAIVNPIQKPIISIGFSQCELIKRLFKEDYDSLNKTEPDVSELTLNFITRNVNVSYKLTAAAELIPQSAWFNPQKPLKIYLHGFTDDPFEGPSFASLSTAFLNQGDWNIVAVDASSLIGSMYLRSTTMVRFIGEELGKLLAATVSAGLQPSNIHLIGHSLGSHISGFAGKTFTMLTGHRVGRISGLDPAGPCFSNVNATFRLNINDADFVDVIHTDAGINGMNEPVGHADYYPNGGSNQPNCLSTLLRSCSHGRVWLLFSESIMNPRAFPAVSCTDWEAFRSGRCDYNDISLMGYAAQPGTSGVYFLQTAGEAPFGLGVDGIKYVNNEGIVGNIGHLIG